MQDDLNAIVPDDIRPRLAVHRNEMVIPYPEVLEGIRAASRNAIAVLGVELFQIVGKELLVLEYSRYEFKFQGDWESFVRTNNQDATKFVEEHVRGEEHGYILTATSKREFDELRRRKGGSPSRTP
jgi:hypothetical protein